MFAIIVLLAEVNLSGGAGKCGTEDVALLVLGRPTVHPSDDVGTVQEVPFHVDGSGMIDGHHAAHLINQAVAGLDVAAQHGDGLVEGALSAEDIGDESLSLILGVVDERLGGVGGVEEVTDGVLGAHEVILQVVVEGRVGVGLLAVAVVHEPSFQVVHILHVVLFHHEVGHGETGVAVGIHHVDTTFGYHRVAFERCHAVHFRVSLDGFGKYLETVVVAAKQFQFLHDVLCVGDDHVVHHVDDTVGTGSADEASQFGLVVEEDAVGTESHVAAVGIVHVGLHVAETQCEILVEEVLCLDISVLAGDVDERGVTQGVGTVLPVDDMVLHQSAGIFLVEFSHAAHASLLQELFDGLVVGAEHRRLGVGILECVIEVGMFEQVHPERVGLGRLLQDGCHGHLCLDGGGLYKQVSLVGVVASHTGEERYDADK